LVKVLTKDRNIAGVERRGEQRVAAMAVATSGCFPPSSMAQSDDWPMNECAREDDKSVIDHGIKS
jgi:hypothetical protein